jgi:hypothetical protein
MLMFEDLTDEQIQSCLTEGIDIERFKRIALTTQKLAPNYLGEGKDCYLISGGHTAALYCIEIGPTFVSPDHTDARLIEFNSHYNAIDQAGQKVNELLTSE